MISIKQLLKEESEFQPVWDDKKLQEFIYDARLDSGVLDVKKHEIKASDFGYIDYAYKDDELTLTFELEEYRDQVLSKMYKYARLVDNFADKYDFSKKDRLEIDIFLKIQYK